MKTVQIAKDIVPVLERVRREIRAGEAAIAADKVYTSDEIKAHLAARRKVRNSQK